MSELFLLYSADEIGKDGYPAEWHQTIKHAVRTAAGNRCIRCGHPYAKGAGQWSPCDEHCAHCGPLGVLRGSVGVVTLVDGVELDDLEQARDVAQHMRNLGDSPVVAAQWRILTVHHLNGVKADCRWWNLASLCQRCHLTIQGRVQMHRVWPWPHSEWFKPYAAGWYAHAYLGEDLDREQTMARLDELLTLELMA